MVVPKYLNCSTFSKRLLPIFMSWFCPAFLVMRLSSYIYWCIRGSKIRHETMFYPEFSIRRCRLCTYWMSVPRITAFDWIRSQCNPIISDINWPESRIDSFLQSGGWVTSAYLNGTDSMHCQLIVLAVIASVRKMSRLCLKYTTVSPSKLVILNT
jgi:hypothetical protein